MEEVRYFNYLTNVIGYDKNYYTDVKIDKSQAVCGGINRILKNKL